MGEEGRVFKLFCQPRFLGKSGVQQVCTWLSPDVVLVKRLYQAGLGNWTANSAVVGDCEWKPWHYGSAFSVVLWAVARIGFNLWKRLSMHVRFHLFIWITVSTAAVAHTWSAQVRGLGRELFEFPYVCATARTKERWFCWDPDLWPFEGREPLLTPEDHHRLLWGEVGGSRAQCLFSRARESFNMCLDVVRPEQSLSIDPFFQEVWKRSYSSGPGKVQLHQQHSMFFWLWEGKGRRGQQGLCSVLNVWHLT